MTRPTTRLVPAELLESLTPFETAGALKGRNYLTGTGRLRGHALRCLTTDRHDIDYVVYSYSTPIAWHTPAGWTRVADDFSPTTGKHQSALRYPEEPRTVGFSWSRFSDAQFSMIRRLYRAGRDGVTPRGGEKRTMQILVDAGIAHLAGFNVNYVLRPEIAERIA